MRAKMKARELKQGDRIKHLRTIKTVEKTVAYSGLVLIHFEEAGGMMVKSVGDEVEVVQ